MLRKITLLAMILVLAYAASAQSNFSGFSGYTYGSNIHAIAKDMDREGYTLIDRTDSALWYSTTMLTMHCELGYIFTDDRLIGGVMILGSVTEQDFMLLNQRLAEAYGSGDITTGKNGMVATYNGPDSTITQTLDTDKGIHEVEYIQER